MALWRTLELWVKKIKQGILTGEGRFVCSTNRKIPDESLLRFIKTNSFDDVTEKIKEIIASQEAKLKKRKEKSGSTVPAVIKLMKLVLEEKDSFRAIHTGLEIEDEENVKPKFFNRIHAGADRISNLTRENIYQSCYGWLLDSTLYKWRNSSIAKFTKKEFDEKLNLIRTNPAIVNAIFRTKESLGIPSENEIYLKRGEIFVKQIEDIPRRKEALERIIKNAITDFICADVELKRIIEKGEFTRSDFDAFLGHCRAAWQDIFDRTVIKEINEYSEEEKNELAVLIYDKIMGNAQLYFQDIFQFTISNIYMQNGCFLKLSNIPEIGWHPEWRTKY